jgi:DNA-binding transcriptional MerR regulator
MKLTDLAAAADTTPRTIRYYIAQGLLPPPAGAGPTANYTDEHLRCLALIRQLQAAHLPLAEIRSRIEAGGGPAQPVVAAPSAGGSALDYLNAVLPNLNSPIQSPRAAPPAPPLPAAQQRRSTWERHCFGADVELHIRRPLSREDARRVDALLDEARRLFVKESP